MARGTQTVRQLLSRTLGVALLGSLISTSASAQVTWSIDNISPVQSDRDGSNPNSASAGRVHRVGEHPTNNDRYIAASEWGGLFRTTDGGRNWTYLRNHVAQATYDVAYRPSNGNHVVATSRFDGRTDSRAGINVSYNGGTTWFTPPTSFPDAADCEVTGAENSPTAYGLAYDPNDTNDVYVGTICGVARSTSNGATWDFIDPTPGDGGGTNVWDVIVHNNGIIDVCGDDGHQRSTDGGNTWDDGDLSEPGGQCSLAVSPDESDVLFMTVGRRIYQTLDGGDNWTNAYTNPETNPQGRVLFVKINDRGGRNYDIWFGDVNLFRGSCTTPTNTNSTANRCTASNTWTQVQQGAHNDVGDVVFNTEAANNACPTIFANDGGVFYNTRTGNNCHNPRWEQPDTSPRALWLWDMEGEARGATGEEGLYLGNQDTGGFGSRNAASSAPTWRAPACCDIFDVEAEDNRVVYTICCFNSGPRTQMFIDGDNFDGGSQIPNYPPGNLIGFRDTDTLVNYSEDSYAVVTSSGIFYTNDISASTINWRSLGTGQPANPCGIYASRDEDGRAVFYARTGNCNLDTNANAGIWRHDGASTGGAWTQVQRDGNNQFGVFTVNPQDADHLLAQDQGAATPTMVMSTNGGDTWNPLPTLDTALTGNGDFLATVTRGATNWYGQGSYNQPSVAAINPFDRRVMVVGGQDSGIFLSVDWGRNWRLMTDPRNNQAVRPHISRPMHAYFERIGGGKYNLYLGARGRGAWRIALNVENRWAGAIWRSTGAACSGDSCPGWRRMDNNVRTTQIAAAGNDRLYQLHMSGDIWRSTGGLCQGDSCPGWTRLDNNSRSVAIDASADRLFQVHRNGRIWQWLGSSCQGQSCPSWRMLDNNPSTRAITASGNKLYQLHRDGKIWIYTGTACSGDNCPGWRMLDNNPRTVEIVASGDRLFQVHYDGRVWQYTGTPCSGQNCPGWRLIDNNPRTADISGNSGVLVQRHRGGDIFEWRGGGCSGNSCPSWRRVDNNSRSTDINGAGYQLHHNGWIWRSTGTPCSGDSCPGWRRLDNNPRTKLVEAADGRNDRLYQLHAPKLYQLHDNGQIWQSVGARCDGDSCRSWQRLDNNPRTVQLAASAGALFQLHNNGHIWRSNGRPCVADSCPGWQRLDNNRRSKKIVSSAGQLFQLHDNGAIWRFTGTACSGDSCPGWVRIDNNPRATDIVSGGGQLYQLHNNGSIWRWTGRNCNGNSCPGWRRLDNNTRTRKIVAAGGMLHQLHEGGAIFTHTGVPCNGNSCPGWRRMDNNPRTTDIFAGGRELYQIHNNRTIWESTGVPCTGNSCPGWRRLDNNSRSRSLAAAGGQLYQLHNNGHIWRSVGGSCNGNSCPSWVRLDNNGRTKAIVAAKE